MHMNIQTSCYLDNERSKETHLAVDRQLPAGKSCYACALLADERARYLMHRPQQGFACIVRRSRQTPYRKGKIEQAPLWKQPASLAEACLYSLIIYGAVHLY